MFLYIYFFYRAVGERFDQVAKALMNNLELKSFWNAKNFDVFHLAPHFYAVWLLRDYLIKKLNTDQQIDSMRLSAVNNEWTRALLKLFTILKDKKNYHLVYPTNPLSLLSMAYLLFHIILYQRK